MFQTKGSAGEGLAVGDRAVVSRTFTEADVALFGGVTGDLNPYHYDREFVRTTTFERPIVHGLLVGSLLTHVGGQWAWLATRLDFEFVAPVFFGDTVTVEVGVTERDEKGRFTARARFVNQSGGEVARAVMEGYPPREKERAVLTRVPGKA